MPPEPVVSVVVPTFNRVQYLESCIDSVLAQTWPAWELLVVDDGSVDRTPEYLRGLTDPRIRVLSLSHSGLPARVRNAGIAAARGDFVAFLDSDDLWLPQKLERQLSELQRDSRPGWSYTDVDLIDAAGHVLPKSQFKEWKPYSGEILEQLLVHDAMVACPTVLAKRSLLQEVGSFDETLPFSEDYDLWLRLVARSPVLAVPARLSRVRLHSGNNTRGEPAVNRAFVRVYTKFLATERPGWRVRRLCNRQRAHYAMHYANQIWLAGSSWRAIVALGWALRFSPFHAGSWKSLVRVIVAAVIPGFRQRPRGVATGDVGDE